MFFRQIRFDLLSQPLSVRRLAQLRNQCMPNVWYAVAALCALVLFAHGTGLISAPKWTGVIGGVLAFAFSFVGSAHYRRLAFLKDIDAQSLNKLSEMIEHESELYADKLIARKLIADYVAAIQAMGRKVIAGEFEALCRVADQELEVAEEVKAQRKLDSTLSPK